MDPKMTKYLSHGCEPIPFVSPISTKSRAARERIEQANYCNSLRSPCHSLENKHGIFKSRIVKFAWQI